MERRQVMTTVRRSFFVLAAAAGCVEPTPEAVDVAEPVAEPASDVALDLLAGHGELLATRVHVSEAGIRHQRYQQTVDGVPVRGAEAIVHTRPDGTLRSITDERVLDLDVDTTPSIDAAE